MTCRFIIPILYLLVGLSIVAFTSARTQILQGTKSTEDKSGRPAPLYKFLLLNAILLSSAVLLWPVFLPSWFGRQRVLPDLLMGKLALEKKVHPPTSTHEEEPQDMALMPVDALEWNLITKYGSVKEAEAANMVTDARLGDAPVPFGSCNDAWNQLLAQMQDGDELWTFSTSEESWEHLVGRAGVSLVRHGEVIGSIVTEMN